MCHSEQEWNNEEALNIDVREGVPHLCSGCNGFSGGSPLNKVLMSFAALCALIAAPTLAEAAVRGFATANVNMRSGPSTSYPAVTVIPDGTSITINGCLSSVNWCDVSFFGGRGWVSGNYVQATYRSNRVYVGPTYYRSLGIPLVTFDVDTYWGRHYRDRDFYRERDRWRRFTWNPRNNPPPPPPPRWDRDRDRWDGNRDRWDRNPPRWDRDRSDAGPPRWDRDRDRDQARDEWRNRDRDRDRQDAERGRDRDRDRAERDANLNRERAERVRERDRSERESPRSNDGDRRRPSPDSQCERGGVGCLLRP